MQPGIVLSLSGISEYKKEPREKGRSLLSLPKNFTIIDIETTGLSPDFDEIIEISAVKVRNDEIIDKLTSLIKPEDEIDDFITELTGITNDMLKNAPELDSVIDKFIDFIGTDIIVGHNVNFDINFLYDNIKMLRNKKFFNDFVDTLRLSKKVYQLENYKLTTICDYLKIDTQNSHRAEKDCLNTFSIYKDIKQKIVERYGSIDNLPKNQYSSLKVSDRIQQSNNLDLIDTDSIFYGKNCVITGQLKYPRVEIAQAIVNIGGFYSDTLTKKTNILILGTNDYTKTKDGKSNKLKTAEKYILQGQDLMIMSEDVLYDNLVIENINNDK